MNREWSWKKTQIKKKKDLIWEVKIVDKKQILKETYFLKLSVVYVGIVSFIQIVYSRTLLNSTVIVHRKN